MIASQNVAPRLGEDATLACVLMGDDYLMWLNPAGRNIASAVGVEAGHYSLDGNNLTIQRVDRQDAGTYGCGIRETPPVLHTAQVIVLGKQDISVVVVFVTWRPCRTQYGRSLQKIRSLRMTHDTSAVYSE